VEDRERFATLCGTLDKEAERLRALPVQPVGEHRRLFVEEIWASAGLAGCGLTLAETATLVESGQTSGARRLEEYVTAADYADAAAFVLHAPAAGGRRPFIRLEEIVELHARALRRTPAARPGAWRRTTASAFPGGTVAPPAWLVPRDAGAFVERFRTGPPPGTHAVRWIATAHERFTRLHPFDRGNGRVARLLANLMLRRCGFPPFVIRPREAAAYLAALRRADSNDPWPLAIAFARSVLECTGRLHAASGGEALSLRPLASFATGTRRAALYKAVQRARLRTVRRGGTIFTTAAWIAEYDSRG